MSASTIQPLLSRDPSHNYAKRTTPRRYSCQIISEPPPQHDRLRPTSILSFGFSGEGVRDHQSLGRRTRRAPEAHLIAQRFGALHQLPRPLATRGRAILEHIDLRDENIAQCREYL